MSKERKKGCAKNTNKMVPNELPGNIFSQPWWLDIVAPGKWEDIRIENNGEIVARMPIVLKRKMGMVYIQMPRLTQKMGPWIQHKSDKIESQHNWERSALKKIIDRLPYFDYFDYNLNSNIVNFLPFSWVGFDQYSITTFRISYPFELDDAYAGFKGSVRTSIRKVEKQGSSIIEIDSNEIYNLVSMTYKRQNKVPPYSAILMDKIITEGKQQGRIETLGLVDDDARIHAGMVLLHDDDTTYYLAGGIDSDSHIAGAMSTLIWKGIQLAHSKGNSFDFEGSSIESIEKFFSSFGAEVLHFHKIVGMSKKYAPIYYGKKLFRKLRSNF